MLPTIALIGRPNVGKSTLFNRFIRANRAITHDRPGVTRDRMEGEVRVGGFPFRVVDTGGVTLDETLMAAEGPDALRGYESKILEQARLALASSRAVLLVVDGREGLNPLDERLARFVRRSDRPALVAVNKVDGPELADELSAEFYALGLDLMPVSAAHGHGLPDLVEAMRALLEAAPAVEKDEEPAAEQGLRLAMLGKPNAGKSSMVNALMGEERMIVSEIPGTTRDSVDVGFELEGRRYTFVDTAGVRRRTRITDQVERYSVNAALKTAQRADVAVLVLDAMAGLTAQDKRLISFLDNYKIAFLVALNKIDLVNRQDRAAVRKVYEDALAFCRHVPLLAVSALTGSGLDRVLPLAERIREESMTRVSTGKLNRVVRESVVAHQPPLVKGRRAKFYYMTQAEVNPPTFICFVNDPERVKAEYAKFLEGRMRKLFGLAHAPMRLHFRASGDNWEERERAKGAAGQQGS